MNIENKSEEEMLLLLKYYLEFLDSDAVMQCIRQLCREAENNDPDAVSLLHRLAGQFEKLNASYAGLAEYIDEKFKAH
jgi:hypothetical protein